MKRVQARYCPHKEAKTSTKSKSNITGNLYSCTLDHLHITREGGMTGNRPRTDNNYIFLYDTYEVGPSSNRCRQFENGHPTSKTLNIHMIFLLYVHNLTMYATKLNSCPIICLWLSSKFINFLHINVIVAMQ